MQSTYDKIQYYTIKETEKSSLIAKLEVFFACNDRIKSAILFGSVNRRSRIRDLDIAIQAEPELTFKEQLNLNAELELQLNIPIDLIQITQTPENVKSNITKTGVKIK